MYNTLNGQLTEFLVTAKELNGRKRAEGGDIFEVEISTQEGELVHNNPAKDCGNGTYSFCFTPIHGIMEYQLSVKLNGCHVRGSPFAWFNEIWNLYTQDQGEYVYPDGRHSCYIQLTENNMKATLNFRQRYHRRSNFYDHNYDYCYDPDDRYDPHDRYDPGVDDDYHIDSKFTVFGSSSFGFGKHSWKVSISGDFTAGFAFGVGAIPQNQYPNDSHWTWSSGHKYQPSSQCQQSAITNCMNNDLIEFYLDCDNQTLTMYNQRTTQLDTWRRIQGEVHPMFQLCRSRDEVTLPCQPNPGQEVGYVAFEKELTEEIFD